MLSRKYVCLLLFASLALMTAAGLSAVVFGQAPALPVPSSGPAVTVEASATDAEQPSSTAPTPSDAPGGAANVAPADGVSRTVTTVISAQEPGSPPGVAVQRSASPGRRVRDPMGVNPPMSYSGVNVPVQQGGGGMSGGVAWGNLGSSPYGMPGAGGMSRYYIDLASSQRLREADPELAKLLEEDSSAERLAAQLAEQYRSEKDETKRAELKTKLEQLVNGHFDLRQQRRQREVAQLEKQLNRIRSAIENRTQAKDLIIQRHLAKLLGEEDDLAF